MIGGALLRSAAKLGRMTCEDAADLAAVFAQVAGRQARDALTTARRSAARRAGRGEGAP